MSLLVTVESATQKDNHKAVDRAGDDERYTELEWFKDIKRRWSYNTEGLRKYILNPWIRSVSFTLATCRISCTWAKKYKFIAIVTS